MPHLSPLLWLIMPLTTLLIIYLLNVMINYLTPGNFPKLF